MDSYCDIVSFQETKKLSFDMQFIRKNCPSSFDMFEFLPLVGASRGLLIAWKSSLWGRVVFPNPFSLSLEFNSRHNGSQWIPINVFVPCILEGKAEFISWLKEIQMHDETDWVVVGDFNLIGKLENKKKENDDTNIILAFNETISYLELTKNPL